MADALALQANGSAKPLQQVEQKMGICSAFWAVAVVASSALDALLLLGVRGIVRSC